MADMIDNRNPVVDAWFEKYDNPQKDLVQAVRALILDTDPRITEVIKWQAPSLSTRATSPRSIRSPSSMCRWCSIPAPHSPIRAGCSRAKATRPGCCGSLTMTTWTERWKRSAGSSPIGSPSKADHARVRQRHERIQINTS
jgi:hypothetical protein